MSRSATDLLEFSRLLELVRGYSTCAPGRRATESLAPSQDRARLESDFALVREAMEWLRGGGELGFGALADPEPWLSRLGPESGAAASTAVLAPMELLDAASLLETARWLREYFLDTPKPYPLLAARAFSLGDFRPIANAIRRAILPDGAISDDASPALRRIRTALGRARDSIQKTLRDILRSRGAESSEDYVTLRNDRYVIPVRAADRRQSGVRDAIVHGASATGQTIFVEPLAAIELNNKLVELAEEEAGEIARILAELTDLLRAQEPALRHAANTIAELDSLFARARFAREFDCALPVFSNNARIRLDSVRHPVLEASLRREGGHAVPMSLALGANEAYGARESATETILVISGPNTGGKTVALKTVGLAALSAQSGIPVAAQSAELPLFDKILADIGDEQSIAANLSTFSAHMLNLRSMLEAATENSLVLVDELGTGTAPEEGAALAVALLEEFRARRCLTLATTHHDRLKAYASTTPGVLNAAVEFDSVNLRPTYRLMVGVPGGSSGISIAERLGLPARVLERARAEITPAAREAADLIAYLHASRDEVDRLRASLHEQMESLERERANLQTEWIERQRKRIAELEHQFAASLKQHEAALAQALESIKDRELRARIEKQTGRTAAKSRTEARDAVDAAVIHTLSDSQHDLGPAAAPAEKPVEPARLTPGVKIRIKGFPSPVILRSIDLRGADSAFAKSNAPSGHAEIEAGPLRMKISLDDIISIVEAAAPIATRGTGSSVAAASRASGAVVGAPLAAPPRNITVNSQPSDASATDDINVIGQRLEEATRLVDKFIDQSAVAGKIRVRIIHGHGTGALRRGLAEFLSAHPLVERISHESDDRGGQAITVVQLRND
ncbi:MAG TPA: Smr/MutS family protein [Candidatus Acidoferrum sp.]|nr:Smr/MutS family protein [Candidatus Acidoferrum sp.]